MAKPLPAIHSALHPSRHYPIRRLTRIAPTGRVAPWRGPSLLFFVPRTPAPESTVRVRSGRLLPAPRPGLAGEPSGTVTALVDRRRDPSRQRRVSRARRPACGPRRARTRSPGLEGPHGRPTVTPRFEQVYVELREARTFAVSDLGALLHITTYTPQYTPTTPSLECPSSSAIVRRAAVSIWRFVPVSVRRAGPPAAGAFQPVSSS